MNFKKVKKKIALHKIHWINFLYKSIRTHFIFSYDEHSKVRLTHRHNISSSIYRSAELPYGTRGQVSNGGTEEETLFSLNVREDKDFRCPRCGKRMQEPRLLPCLHPICSPCVSELMSGCKRYRTKIKLTPFPQYILVYFQPFIIPRKMSGRKACNRRTATVITTKYALYATFNYQTRVRWYHRHIILFSIVW